MFEVLLCRWTRQRKKSSARRACPKDRKISPGSVWRRRSTAALTERKTEASAWSTAVWPHMLGSISWPWLLTTINVGCCRMGYTVSRLSFTQHKREADMHVLGGTKKALRAQTRVSGHCTNNRWQARPAWLQNHGSHGKRVDYQRPVGVCGSFFPTFKLVRRAEKAYIHVGGQFVSFTPTGLTYGVEGFAAASFSLTVAAGFLPVRRVTSLFSASTTSGSRLTGTVNRWRTGRGISTAYW